MRPPRAGARAAHLHDRRRRATSPASTASRRAPATPARTASRSRSPPATPKRSRAPSSPSPRSQPAGLGARDTLRLEAGLCLYGHEIDTTTTPIEAGLTWAIQKVRRPGGERAGGYPGAATIERQLAHGTDRKRVGLVGNERAPVREGAAIVDDAGIAIGRVTSGTDRPERRQADRARLRADGARRAGHEARRRSARQAPADAGRAAAVRAAPLFPRLIAAARSFPTRSRHARSLHVRPRMDRHR